MNVAADHHGLNCEAQGEQRGWKRQFMRPEGWVGGLFGRLMARKNADQTLTGIELFDVRPQDHVLEIGFGPGVGIQALTARAREGRVCGVDWSNAMVAQAAQRNRAAVSARRVELRHGAADRLPYPDAVFDKVFEANSFHIWPDRDAALREIYRVLKPGGRLMLCLRMKHPTRTKFVAPGHTVEDIRTIAASLEPIGLTIQQQETRELGRTITYLVAAKPN
jgi:ubiquinone/menaquinone biosynthesis C-methylase UbiE